MKPDDPLYILHSFQFGETGTVGKGSAKCVQYGAMVPPGLDVSRSNVGDPRVLGHAICCVTCKTA